MPRLSDSMEEGTIGRWLKIDGDTVAAGDELVEIETDKATVVYESDVAGKLCIVAAVGETVAIGAPIARLDQVNDPDPLALKTIGPRTAQDGERQTVNRPASGRGIGAHVSASPVARRTAARLGIDLRAVDGSGPRARVFKHDVLAESARAGATSLLEQPKLGIALPGSRTDNQAIGEKGRVTRVTLTRAQRAIARRMTESRATVPDFQVSLEVDMTPALQLLERKREQLPTSPSVNDLIVRGLALALAEHPKINGSYRDGELELYDQANIGIAVDVADGLLVPVLKNAGGLGLAEVAEHTRILISRARAGTITPAELSGATITVSNLGMHAAGQFVGIINPPQSAILCVGAISPRPVIAITGGVEARSLATFTLVCDHRILYGTDAAAFLAQLRQILERPRADIFCHVTDQLARKRAKQTVTERSITEPWP